MRLLNTFMMFVIAALFTVLSACHTTSLEEQAYIQSEPIELAVIYVESLFFNPFDGSMIGGGTGSGSVVQRYTDVHGDEHGVVLTAAHVCENPLITRVQFADREHPGEWIDALHNISGRTILGDFYTESVVLALDHDIDVCLVDFTGEFPSQVYSVGSVSYMLDGAPARPGLELRGWGYPLGLRGDLPYWSVSPVNFLWAGFLPPSGDMEEGQYILMTGSEVMMGHSGGPVMYGDSLVSVITLDIGLPGYSWEYAAGPSPDLLIDFLMDNEIAIEVLR